VANEFGVELLIFSSLLSVKNTTKSRLVNVPHFDIKAEIEQYIRYTSVPANFFLPDYFISKLNITIRPGIDGMLIWVVPISKHSKLPMIDTKRDTSML